MKNAANRIVGPCLLCGRHFYSNHKTRPPKYCWECAEFARKENNKNRQQAWRDRHKQKATPARDGKGGGGEVRSGGEGPVTPALRVAATSRRLPQGGLFADMPREQANDRRARLGLPALIA